MNEKALKKIVKAFYYEKPIKALEEAKFLGDSR